MSGFMNVNFEYGKIHFVGGMLKKSLPMTTRQVDHGGKTTIFVKMSVNEPWLLQSTVGPKGPTKASFGRTTLLDQLREVLERACNDDGAEDISCVGDAEDAVGDEVDPMQELEINDSEGGRSSTCGRGAKRKRYYKNVRKN